MTVIWPDVANDGFVYSKLEVGHGGRAIGARHAHFDEARVIVAVVVRKGVTANGILAREGHRFA